MESKHASVNNTFIITENRDGIKITLAAGGIGGSDVNAPVHSKEEAEKSGNDLKERKPVERIYKEVFAAVEFHRETSVNISDENAGAWVEALKQHRFIVIESPLDDVNLDCCRYLFQKTACSQAFKAARDPVDTGSIFDAVTKKEKTGDAQELYLIEVEASSVRKLGAHLSRETMQWYTVQLLQQQRYVIFIHSSVRANSGEEAYRAMAGQPVYFQVDFIEAFLEKHVSSSDALATFAAAIRIQKTSGLWSDPQNDPHAFLLELQSAVGRLEEEIELRKKYDSGIHISVQEFRKTHIEKVKAEHLVPSEDNVKKLLLFVVAFFENLSLRDVLEVTKFLISFKEEPKKFSPQPAKTQPDNSAKKGKNKAAIPPERAAYSWWDDWTHNRGKIFNEAYLVTETWSQTQGEVVTFSIRYLQPALRQYFEKKDPLYLFDHFGHLLHADILMARGTSRSLRAGFIRLLASMAAKDPDNYGPNLLWDMVSRFNVKNLELSILSGNDDDALSFEAFLKKGKALQASEDIQLIVTRLADLINVMFTYPHLKRMTDNFFDHLIGKGLLGNMLVFHILEVVQRDSGSFDAGFELLRWLKKIAANSDNGALREKAYALLLTVALQSEDRLHEVIQTVVVWKNESFNDNHIVHPGLYEISHRIAYDLCRWSLKKIDYKLYGKIPSHYTLFAPLFSVAIEREEYFNLLISQLFDLRVAGIEWITMREATRNESLTYEIVYWETQRSLAFIVEEWFLLLRHTPTGETSDGAREVSDLLLKAVGANLPRMQRKWLLDRWRWKRNNYLHLANQLKRDGKSEERQWIKVRRSSLTELIQELQTIKK